MNSMFTNTPGHHSLKMWNQMKLELHIIWFINYSPRFTNYNNVVYTPNQGPMFSSSAYKPNKDFTHCKPINKMRVIHWGYICSLYLVNTWGYIFTWEVASEIQAQDLAVTWLSCTEPHSSIFNLQVKSIQSKMIVNCIIFLSFSAHIYTTFFNSEGCLALQLHERIKEDCLTLLIHLHWKVCLEGTNFAGALQENFRQKTPARDSPWFS